MFRILVLSVVLVVTSGNIFEDILTLNSVTHADSGNTTEHAVIIQGDIAVDDGKTKRSAITSKERLWPKEIPYDVSSHPRRDTIVSAMNTLSRLTGNCLRFRTRRGGDPGYMKFIVDSGCWSYVGNYKKSSGQPISIGRGCEHAGIIQHEIMHALGFWHEQSRTDRDRYVQILTENITPAMIHNFKIQQGTDTQGIEYDYSSIMHYGSRAFSRNGRETIKSKKPGKQLGQRSGPSPKDIEGIKKLYGCSGGGGGGGVTTARPPVVTSSNNLCFEKGIGGNWVNIDWKVRRGCPKTSKEPKLDRKQGQGHFAYVDITTNKRRGILRLKPTVVVKRTCKVTFYMYPGSNLFTFQLKVKRPSAGKKLVQVYKISGRQAKPTANKWQLISKQLQKGDTQIQFFARVKKSTSTSAFALDDIRFDGCF